MRNAQRTRQRLQDAALRLFSERGFDGVTVEEIAGAAGVSHMTFFRHFPTKESVVMEDPYDPLIAAGVGHTDPALPALERARRGLLESLETVEGEMDHTTRLRLQLAAGHPTLRARMWENNRATEKAIVEALMDTGTADLAARVAAGAVLGALTAALLDWAEASSSEPVGQRLRSALELLSQGSSE